MYNKTILRFAFCDILNNQGLGECYQPRLSARLKTLNGYLRISQKAHPIMVYNCRASQQSYCLPREIKSVAVSN